MMILKSVDYKDALKIPEGAVLKNISISKSILDDNVKTFIAVRELALDHDVPVLTYFNVNNVDKIFLTMNKMVDGYFKRSKNIIDTILNISMDLITAQFVGTDIDIEDTNFKENNLKEIFEYREKHIEELDKLMEDVDLDSFIYSYTRLKNSGYQMYPFIVAMILKGYADKKMIDIINEDMQPALYGEPIVPRVAYAYNIQEPLSKGKVIKQIAVCREQGYNMLIVPYNGIIEEDEFSDKAKVVDIKVMNINPMGERFITLPRESVSVLFAKMNKALSSVLYNMQ